MVRLFSFRSVFALFGLGALLAVAMYAQANATMKMHAAADTDQRLAVVAVPGYHVQLFTSASSTVKNPDSVAVDGNRVFIDYQNVTSKTGRDGKSSTVVEYNMEGKALKQWSVPGHSDGMRIDPATHLVWTTSNEDANATFALIDPNAGGVTTYTFPHRAPRGRLRRPLLSQRQGVRRGVQPESGSGRQ